MYKRGRLQNYDDCIDSRLLIVASLSPRFASSTDLITSTSMSGNMSLTTATSASVTGTGWAATGCCCCGGLAAPAGTAGQFTQSHYNSNDGMIMTVKKTVCKTNRWTLTVTPIMNNTIKNLAFTIYIKYRYGKKFAK